MSRIARRTALLRQLHGGADIVCLAWVSLFAMVVPLLMRLSLPRLDAILTPRRRGRALSGEEHVDRIIRCVEIALGVGSPVLRDNCLTRAVTLYWFLTRAGVEVELCFGFGQVDGRPGGHSWLALGGRPFLEPDDPRAYFAEMCRLPGVTAPCIPQPLSTCTG